MSVTSALPREQAIARILELTGQPNAKRPKPWLVVTVGLPGSGKSTFCRKLAKAAGVIVLESDSLRRALFETPTHETDESRQLFDALYGAAERLLTAGASVIVDATNLRERDRERAYEVASRAGSELLLLHFDAPISVIAERLSCRDRHDDPEDRSTAGMAVYARLAETEEPVVRDHWRIDTSDAEATSAALQRAIEILTSTPKQAEGPSTGGTIS